MGKIFYAKNSNIPSETLLRHVLSAFYGIENAEIERIKHGKPYLKEERAPFFSISHTKETVFIAIADAELGLDAELISRTVDYPSILSSYFSEEERREITSTENFLKHWIVKESFIKYLGGTIARDLKRIAYVNGILSYDEQPCPAKLTFLQFDGHLISVCSKNEFNEVEWIPIPTL